MHIYYNPNPLSKQTGDCVIRAIARATGMPWGEVFLRLMLLAYERKEMPSENILWMKFLHDLGLTRTAIPDTCPDCYTIADFASDHPEGTYIVATGTHVVAVVSGDWYDTWDSGCKIPIYYWRVSENG